MAAFENWESQLHARASEMVARRIAPLKVEIERLQAVVSEIGSRLLEDSAITEAESVSLIEEIKRLFDDRAAKAEEDFKSRLEEAVANARREAEIQIEELRRQIETGQALTTAVASPQPSSRSFEMFKAAIEDIDSQRTQSDTLAALVRHAAEFAPRVVFFVIKSGDAVGWKARGFDNGLNDETVKLLTMPAQKSRLLREALTSLRVAVSDPQATGEVSASETLGIYGSPAPERAIAIPLIVLNKAVAVLYADSGAHPGDSLNTPAAESLTRIAGKTIEFVIARRSAETARPGAHTAAPAETSPATHLKTDGKAMGAAIQQTPSQLTAQPAVQMDSVGVEPAIKQDSERDIPRESREIYDAPQIENPFEATPASLDRVTIERRRTVELPQGFDKDSHAEAQADQGLRQAEAQLPEPAYIESEPGAAPEPHGAGGESVETGAGLSGRLRAESLTPPTPPTPPPAPPSTEVEQQPAISAPTPIPSRPLPDFVAPPAEEPPVSSETPSFSPSPPPPPPVFSAPVKTPKPAQPSAAVPGGEAEQRAHNDARRFARLLVSEIKLYNAVKVNDGRRNYDLYDRLKDEIDSKRKMYDRRVAPTVAARIDYYYEELVQILAEGDPAKLGKDCPGPVAVA